MVWIALAAALLVIALLALYIPYRITFYASRRRPDPLVFPNSGAYASLAEKLQNPIAQLEAIPYEEVSIRSRDGLRLWGRYYHVRDGAPVEIQFHGYRASAVRDFCGGQKLAADHGRNVLLVDQRAHGKSEGHTITFGIRERDDCRDWIQYVTRRFGGNTPIFLTGISMGAATVLMAAKGGLPTNVAGIIADSPYSSPRDIISRVCRQMGLPTALVYPLIRASARVFGRFSLEETSALSAVADCTVPILILHGETDDFVPCVMSEQIRKANPSLVEYHTFPHADHGLSFVEAPERYARVVTAFADRCLSARR
jgi:pimeloyl-ACP methyl ester carboxylesterase